MIIGIDASRANVPEKTGTEFYGWHVIKELAPLLRQHQVRLYSRETLEPSLANLGTHIESRVLRWPPGVLWSHLRLSIELLLHPPDVLFVPADTVPLWHPRRTVTTIHDVAFERFPELYRSDSVQKKLGWLRPLINLGVRLVTGGRYSASEVDYHRWSVRHGLRSCPRIITISQFSKQELLDLFHLSPGRITVTHLGVKQPEEYDDITQEESQKTLDTLRIQQPYFLSVGRLEKKKNIDGLLQAYRIYTEQVQHPLDLVLLGAPGHGWDEMAKRYIDDHVRSRIHVLAWQPLNVRNVLQKSAQALAMVSHYEGFGFPPLESLSAGVPVVASRAGSLPEVLGSSAVLVDQYDYPKIAQALEQISTDQALRQRLITQGRTHVRQFQWSATASQTLPILVDWPQT